MDILTTFEILGSLSGAGIAYMTADSFGFGAKYWTLRDPEDRRSFRDAAYIRRTWRRLARHLQLALKDDIPTFAQSFQKKPEVKIRTPKLLAIRSDAYGLFVDFKPLPRIGEEEFAKQAQHLANYWGMVRVGVEQIDPRRIRVRAVRRDPLRIKRSLARPTRVARDLTSVPFALDDYGRTVRLVFESATGVGIYGAPRWGKTSLMLGILTALMGNEEVQFILADGKVSTGFEGDYYDFGHRCLSVIGDSIADYNALIKDIVKLREMRQSVIRQELGVPNFWMAGPSRKWPLIIVVIDEAHSYFKQIKPDGGNSALKEQNALAAENAWLTEDAVKKCGSVGIFFMIATQKPTVDAIPSAIRDNLTHRICLGVATDAVATAALTEEIKDYPEFSPLQFYRNEFRGCGVMKNEDRPGFARWRAPYCGPRLVATAAQITKELVSTDGMGVSLSIGTDHRKALPDTPDELLSLEKGEK
ncbi:hypothetical protein [Nocardia tengchongensis]|uniref:hypothetical protein n=1 Tax=Nocardia tengchongensis TaxID=2055889 RepID=UPI0036D04416